VASAAADRDRLFVGAGTVVRTVDLARLEPSGEWRVPEPVAGLASSPGGSHLYVAQTGAVSWHDSATGAARGRADVSGLVGLHGLAAAA
jgi:hypothetical protein